MKIQGPSFQEKRQFERIEIPESTICKIYVPQSQKLWENQGKIKNISLGGIYFACDEKPPLEKNDIQHLILDALYNDQKLYRLEFYGLVVRTENIISQFGVALKFISDPMFYPLTESNYHELLCFDKTRILYQHYQLYKKACEIVKRTPDIRVERIKDIKNKIDQDLYKIHTKNSVQIFRVI